jgi:hypothetical protein
VGRGRLHGLILADNGSDWYLTGDSDDRWGPLMDVLVPELRTVHGSDFRCWTPARRSPSSPPEGVGSPA